MTLAGRLFRERTATRVDDDLTFNAPGTYFPQYGKGVFRVGGRGASGTSNPPTGGNTNPAVKEVITQTTFVRKDEAPNDVANSVGNWTGNVQPSPYCDPTQNISGNSNVYNTQTVCYLYSTSPGTTNPTTPGNSNTGAAANIFGVPFPGGVGTIAPVVADTVVSIPFLTAGYAVTVPPGGYVTFKNT